MRRLKRNPFLTPTVPRLVRPNPVAGLFNGRYSGPLFTAAVMGLIGGATELGKKREKEILKTVPAGAHYAAAVFGGLVWTGLGAWLNNSASSAAGGIAFYNIIRGLTVRLGDVDPDHETLAAIVAST